MAGTTAAELLLDKVTATPPAGATALSATVPVAPFPPVTAEGDTETEVNIARPAAGGSTVNMAATELMEVAVIVTV